MNERGHIAALVLAAGCSSRMGAFKPLLPIAGSTTIQRTIATFLAAGIPGVTVVTGHRAEQLTPVVESMGARAVFNSNYELGMYSSILTGIRSLPPSVQACFVMPGDIALVRPSTIRRLASASPTRIVYPVFQGRRGHPPLLAREVLGQAASDHATGTLRQLLARHEDQATDVPVFDEGIHLDMDTPASLEQARVLAPSREIPTRAECEEMLAVMHVDERVVRHSRVVSRIAQRLVGVLAQRGVSLSLPLVVAGGLLHDVAKGRTNHPQAGADLVTLLGFEALAPVIASHRDIDFSTGRLDEAAIVHLADKLVQGDRVVSLEERFARAFVKFNGNQAAIEAAQRRREEARNIAHAVEELAGIELQEIVRSDV